MFTQNLTSSSSAFIVPRGPGRVALPKAGITHQPGTDLPWVLSTGPALSLLLPGPEPWASHREGKGFGVSLGVGRMPMSPRSLG